MFKYLIAIYCFFFISLTNTSASPKNIIIFIGDGMGISTITAARKYNQEINQKDNLSFEKFPYSAIVDVKCHDYLVPDSACTATAIASGVSANSGVVGLNQAVRRGSFAGFKEAQAKSLLALAEENNYLTGLITNTAITDATPAAFFGHSPEREWQSDADLPLPIRSTEFSDLAKQLIKFTVGDGIDLIMGGGREKFLSQAHVDPEYSQYSGDRIDGQNLLEQWSSVNQGSSFVWNKEQLLEIDPKKSLKLLGLFEPGNLAFEANRNKESDPSLSEMVAWSLDFLQKEDSPGFFLMVEAGRIDHAHHDNLAKLALIETLQLSAAIEVALKKIDLAETLIIVTSDHGHTLGIVGYPKNSDSILGQGYDADAFPAKYSFLNYLSGPGARYAGNKQSLPSNDIQYHQNSLINSQSAKHSGEDVALYATGSGAENFHGAIKQRQIFQIIKEIAKY